MTYKRAPAASIFAETTSAVLMLPTTEQIHIANVAWCFCHYPVYDQPPNVVKLCPFRSAVVEKGHPAC